MIRAILFLFLVCLMQSVSCKCKASRTTVSGTQAPRKVCSKDLIFEDNFNTLDSTKWQHEQTLGGGGNWEFQWYSNDRRNSYVQDGNLHIKPTLVADEFGEAFLSSGTININPDQCTNSQFNGCSRTGTPTNLLNSIKSARLRTLHSFSFKYGKVEIRAKVAAGDWLWPAIWMLPTKSQYGEWPRSGEVDIMESRGNRQLVNPQGVNIGVQQVGSTLHWGPDYFHNRYNLTHFEKNLAQGYNTDFHKFQVEWTPEHIQFSIDDEVIGVVTPPAGGFWELGQLNSAGLANLWKGDSNMAPFDQEFHIILNLAVGGTSYFPDDATNPGGKPWSNAANNAYTTFWQGKDKWLPTWNMNTDDSHLQVDYVKVWAL